MCSHDVVNSKLILEKVLEKYFIGNMNNRVSQHCELISIISNDYLGYLAIWARNTILAREPRGGLTIKAFVEERTDGRDTAAFTMSEKVFVETLDRVSK